jgi:SAM-dependent methyltransferase
MLSFLRFQGKSVRDIDTKSTEIEPVPNLSTDDEWEEWGRRDPYFGVLTHPRFRRANLTESAKNEFFESGRVHVEYVLQVIRNHIDADFTPKRVLEFGCGVGRILIPLARVANEAVGLDVSPSMLKEAERNCTERGITNVQLLTGDVESSLLGDSFDLIHSYIVFQHIPPERGKIIFLKLLKHLRPAGVGALQLTYSKKRFASTYGIDPTVAQPNSVGTRDRDADPEMQMNPYNLNELLFMLQSEGVIRFHAEFVDHGGELGLFLFFRKP